MNSDYGLSKQKSKDHSNQVPQLDKLDSLLGHVLQLISQLESIISRLSYVQEDSNCTQPEADALYAQKGELEDEILLCLQELDRYLSYLSKEILRSKRNLERIRADVRKINLKETQECYFRAEQKQEKQYRSLIRDRKAVCEVIEKANATLKISYTKMPTG
ncbi:hypothetical protein ACFL3G_06055 [Planctomycetota bacterium]